MNVRNNGGNRQNASSGLVNNSAANRSRGMTNGLGGRTNGMTNGLGGRTNGMTNGLGGRTNGLTNGLGGRTNGLTNGLGGRTNGLTNGLGGKTNGLTNGLGSGGPVMRSRRMDDSAISPFRISLIIVIAFIIMVPASFMLLSYNEAAYSGIRVDGDFSDWDEATIFTDAEQYSVANLDIVDYAAGTNDAGSLFFYASARGNWFSGSAADSLMVFIDSDGNPDTGYSIRGMGADYLVDVYGWNSQVQGRQLGIFNGQDQLNWSAWNWRGLSAALTLTEIEVGIQSSTVQLQPTHSFLFLSKSAASVADTCDAAIGLNGGALTVRQTPGGQAGIVSTNQLMTLELRALGSAVNVSAIDFAYSGIASPSVSGLPVTVQPGTPVTLAVTSPVAGLLNGTFIDLSVSAVTSTGVASVTGESLSAYTHAAPGTIRVDGAFADWSGITKATDTDIVADPNIDIARHASVNNSLEAFFYLGLGTNGRMFGGSSVPQARTVPGTPGEPGEPTTPVPLPRVSGEDITRIYIDTVPGGQIAHGILADYMIEIKGREGTIDSRQLFSLPGRTFIMNIDAANNAGELEVGVELGDIGFNTTLSYVMESTDWQGGNDRTAPSSTTPLTRSGTRAGGNFGGGDGTIGNPYLIEDALDLQAMQNNLVAHYALKNNIDASETVGWNSGAGFFPIGTYSQYFRGTFNGRNYTITGLFINRPGSYPNSLFGSISTGASIKNVRVEDVDFTGYFYTAGLVGMAYSSTATISNCHVSGTINGQGSCSGGFAGEVYCIISNCSADCTVVGTGSTTQYLGGFAGYNGGLISNCYARGDVSSSTFQDVGGFAGAHASNTIKYCYSTGDVPNSGVNIGGFIGTYSGGTITSCFWDTDTSGTTTGIGSGSSTQVVGKTTAEMMTETTFTSAGWDFVGETVNGEDDIWTIDEGTSYPYFEVMAPEFHFFLLPILATLAIVSAARIKKKGTECEQTSEDE